MISRGQQSSIRAFVRIVLASFISITLCWLVGNSKCAFEIFDQGDRDDESDITHVDCDDLADLAKSDVVRYLPNFLINSDIHGGDVLTRKIDSHVMFENVRNDQGHLSTLKCIIMYWQVLKHSDGDRAEVMFDVQKVFKDDDSNGRDKGQLSRDWFVLAFDYRDESESMDACLSWSTWDGIHSISNLLIDKDWITKSFHSEYSGKNSPNRNCRPHTRHSRDVFKIGPFTVHSNSFTRMAQIDLTCSNSGLHSSEKSESYTIDGGTTHIYWALGFGPLYSPININVSESTSKNGIVRIQLLKPDQNTEERQQSADDESTQIFDVTHTVDALPSGDTTYWCSAHQIPNHMIRRKHHAIKYEPVLSKSLKEVLHHMEVFQCPMLSKEAGSSNWEGECNDESAPSILKECKSVVAAWAIGATSFVYPQGAGLSIGGSLEESFLMLEVHYNNPLKLSGLSDHGSGIRFHVTPNLRAYDAGIMELGLIYTDAMAIPPGLSQFHLTGYCLPQCTSEGFPSSGIRVFGSQLHTHATGRRVVTQHFIPKMTGQPRHDRLIKDGYNEQHQFIEIRPEINRDDHYSSHFQEIRGLDARRQHVVLPGDMLTTTCTFDTRNRENITFGGYGFTEEMCLNYIHYYPKSDNLQICKSSIDAHDLKTFLEDKNKGKKCAIENNEKVITDVDELRRECFRNLAPAWTESHVEELRVLYEHSSLAMECRGGDDLQLPGKWSEMKKMDRLVNEPPMCLGEDIERTDLDDIRVQMSEHADLSPNIIKRQNSVQSFDSKRLVSVKRGGVRSSPPYPFKFSELWGIDKRSIMRSQPTMLKRGGLGSMG